MGKKTLIAIIGALALMSGAVSRAEAADDDFPRLAHYLTGVAPWDSQALQDYFAKVDWVVVNSWPGWRGAGGVDIGQVAAAVKQRNPSSRMFIYVANNEIWDSTDPGDAYREIRDTAYSMRWWLYQSGEDGARVKAVWGDVNYTLNTSNFSARNGAGKNYNEWFTDWAVKQFIADNPAIDGLFTDNVFWKPTVDGDWNRDGVTDRSATPEAQSMFRQGYASYFRLLREKMPPGRLVLGNVADWGEAGNAGVTLSEYKGMLNGGVLEAAVGKPYSIESWGGWSQLMKWYRGTLDQLSEPKLLLFEQWGRLDDYQAFRYGFATTLMDNGYFQYADINGGGKLAWFDEYDTKLGKAITAPPGAAWQNGVYRRDFENGIALVNPKGNGAVEVDVGEGFRRIAGTQDPSVNNGQVARTVRLKDRDGIVLLRDRPRIRPLPPSNLAVE